jgi:hypothetical protein
VSALFVAFLVSSTAILTVVLGVMGGYYAVSVILSAFNPSRPSKPSTLSAFVQQQSQASGD